MDSTFRRAEHILLVLAIVAAWFGPRLYAYSGLSLANMDMGADVHDHLVNLDRLTTARCLSRGEHARHLTPPEGAFVGRNPVRHPPGVYKVATYWAAYFGPLSPWTTLLSSALFSLLLVGAVVLLGRAAHSLTVGLWAALFCGLNPALVGHSLSFNLDYPLVAMILVGVWLVQASRGLSRPLPLLALGLWSLLGVQVKAAYAPGLLIPCLLALAVGLRERKLGVRQLAVLVGALALVVGGALLLYGESSGKVYEELAKHGKVFTDPGAYFAYRGVAGGLLRLADPALGIWYHFPWPALLLALPGLVLAHTARARGWRHVVLGALWGTYAFAAVLTERDIRYLLPIYPLLCLLTAWWPSALLPPLWRRVLRSLFALVLAATLWWTHTHREPTEVRMERERQLGLFVPPPLPSSQELSELKRLHYSTNNDFRPLARAVGEVLAGELSPGVLALQVSLRKGPHPFPDFMLSKMLHLIVAQQRPGQMVWSEYPFTEDLYHHGVPPDLPDMALGAQHLLQIHDPGKGADRRHPELVLIKRKAIVFTPREDVKRRVVFSLFRNE